MVTTTSTQEHKKGGVKMGKVGRVIAGILLAVTVPTTVAGTVYTVQNFEQVKSWIKGETPTADEKPVDDTEKDEKIKELEAKIQEHLLQIENLQITISELQQGHAQELQILNNQIEGYQTQISTLKNQKAALEESIKGYTQQISILDEQIESLQNEISDLELSAEDNLEEISALQAQVLTLQNEKTELQESNAGYIQQISSLNVKIEGYQTQISTLQGQVAELEEENSNYEESMLNYQGQIAVLQGQIASLEAQIEELEEALASQEQKVEITDWTFVGNSLGAYKGSADVIDNIPTSYSVVESVSTPQTLSSEEEFYSFIEGKMSDEGVLYGNPVRVTFTLLDLTKNYANYAEFIGDFEVLAGTYNVSDLYTCTIEEFNNTYYEGDDIQVNTVGMLTFANTTATTIILPKEFTNLGTIGLSDNVLNFVINSNSPNLEIVARGPYCRFFVPAEFYDSYVSRFEANAPLFIIEADVEPELTYSSFSDFTSSPVEASPQYSHLLAIESYKGTETNVVVPGKSDEKYIYEIRSFETSTAVESIVLPKQIDTIKFDAFKNLTSLTSLTIYCQKVIYAEKGVSIVEPELPSACNIYVPSILVGYYKEAWPTLANRIFAIE